MRKVKVGEIYITKRLNVRHLLSIGIPIKCENLKYKKIEITEESTLTKFCEKIKPIKAYNLNLSEYAILDDFSIIWLYPYINSLGELIFNKSEYLKLTESGNLIVLRENFKTRFTVVSREIENKYQNLTKHYKELEKIYASFKKFKNILEK